MKAITDIKYGYVDEDGENQVVEISADDDVTGLPGDVMDSLVASGAVAEETPTEAAAKERVAELETEILRLRRELGEDVDNVAVEDDDQPPPPFDPDANPQG
jgi:hypothetical protein